MKNLIVYGSLLNGEYNHYLIKDSKLVESCTLKVPFKMISMGMFPALIPDDNLNPIYVEIYEVDDETYSKVEILEGYPDFYNRLSLSKGDIYYLDNINYKKQYSSFKHIENWKQRR